MNLSGFYFFTFLFFLLIFKVTKFQVHEKEKMSKLSDKGIKEHSKFQKLTQEYKNSISKQIKEEEWKNINDSSDADSLDSPKSSKKVANSFKRRGREDLKNDIRKTKIELQGVQDLETLLQNRKK